MTDLTNSKIMIVDDAKSNIALLAETLEGDFDISVARNGERALEQVTEERPDLILLDIMMPGIDGYEVCRRLKNMPETSGIPVIFVSSKTEEVDETRGFAAGAVDYITKPLSPAIVQARVRTHLELKRNREKIESQRMELARRNEELIAAARLREDVEQIMRHDLKQPLQAIISIPQLIIFDGNLSPEHRRLLAGLEEAGYRMLQMVNSSLDLFKMEKGMYELQAEPVDLLPIIRKCFLENQTLIDFRKLRIDIFINDRPVLDEDTFTVSGEALLCHIMLSNILKNAVEASSEGGTITVHLEAEERATVRVHNMGAVPPAIRERFFEKFVTANKKQGTGLGTYSAKLIAETQQGSIAMRTDDEKGTTVTITLPTP